MSLIFQSSSWNEELPHSMQAKWLLDVEYRVPNGRDVLSALPFTVSRWPIHNRCSASHKQRLALGNLHNVQDSYSTQMGIFSQPQATYPTSKVASRPPPHGLRLTFSSWVCRGVHTIGQTCKRRHNFGALVTPRARLHA